MISFLSSALPAPFDWLSWGLLSGPAGLALIGAGVLGLRRMSRLETDGDV